MAHNHSDIDTVYTVHAGKLRRYHNQAWIERFLDFKTIVLNIRDVFRVIIGFFESLNLLIRNRPDVILLKGGFVGLPIGFAASLLRVPYITHDSDARASLTNSLVGKWAVFNTTGSETEFYRYSQKKMIRVGVPVSDKYQPVDSSEKTKNRKTLKIPVNAKMILITGGSLGAREINTAIASIYRRILSRYKDIYIVHQVGKGKMDVYEKLNIKDNHLLAQEFFNDMYKYSAAADLVITRGSATALAELEVQGKPVIVIPNPNLTGGHQIMNGKEITKNNAGVVLSEAELIKNPEILLNSIFRLLDDQKLSKELADNLSKLAVSDAAEQTAEILLKLK